MTRNYREGVELSHRRRPDEHARDGGRAAMNRSGTFCGCFSMCWWCDVHRIAPDVAGKEKVLCPFLWIVPMPIDNCRNQVGNNYRLEVSRDASHRFIDRCMDFPAQLFFGLSFGLIDRNRDLLVDGLLVERPSLPSFLWLLAVARLPRGAISDGVHTSTGRRFGLRDLFQYVQGPVEWGVPLGPRRRL